MMNLKQSTMNGWYFETMKNGIGTGKCKKCGKEITITDSMQFMNLKPCNCSKEKGDE